MKMSTFLMMRVLLPLIVLAGVFLSYYFVQTFESPLLQAISLLPGIASTTFLFWFFSAFGYCPKCRQHLGKNIGAQCRHCGYQYCRSDNVSRN